jgi:hypothetical protein
MVGAPPPPLPMKKGGWVMLKPEAGYKERLARSGR